MNKFVTLRDKNLNLNNKKNKNIYGITICRILED